VPKYLVEEENRALVSLIGRPRTVLDVGCGVGLNGACARRLGAAVTGIEISAGAAAQARERLDEVLELDITDETEVRRQLSERRFDLILFADVLEHLPDPGAVLARFVDLLTDGGRVIVSVPNVAAWTVRLGLLRGRFAYQRSGILDDSHLRFFTRESAIELCRDAGLQVLQVEHNPMLVRAAKGLIQSTMVGLDHHGDQDPFALSRSAPYKLYQGLVRPLEDRIANRAPGLLAFQHVVVARKPPERKPLSLTVGMLTMDEEQSVSRMIHEIRELVPDAQILCVDSSRHDRTPDIARELGARVIRQIPPRGHGPAMEMLMYTAAAQSELLIYLDCDYTYPPSYIPRLRRLVEEERVDVVNCARTRERPAAMPVPNFMANRAFAAMAHAMHGVPTCDVHSGMRAYRTSVIRAFDFDGEGDAIPIDTLLYPAKCGFQVAEIPITYDDREGVSKLRKLTGTVWTFIRLARALPVGRRGATGYTVR